MPELTYRLWLSDIRPVEISQLSVTLAVDSDKLEWIKKRFERVIKECIESEVGESAELVLVSKTDLGSERRSIYQSRLKNEPPNRVARTDRNRTETFENFVIGEGNRLAHAAALSVAELPSHTYNPLFIYGVPGVGKTHLLKAIKAYVDQHSPEKVTRYVTAEEFAAGFVNSLQTGDINRFKELYRGSDLLLVDDVQFLQRKARTEEEFFHTFNCLHEMGKQLVISCDRMPRMMSDVAERLLERFESGLVVQIEPPDYRTRLAALRKASRRLNGVEISGDVIELIAEKTGGFRALEGSLVRITAHQSFTQERVSRAVVEKVLGFKSAQKPSNRAVSIEAIQKVVADKFSVSLEDIRSSKRSAKLAEPRRIAMYLAREMTDQKLPEISRLFGRKSHATVIHAHRKVSDLIGFDLRTREIVKGMLEELSR